MRAYFAYDAGVVAFDSAFTRALTEIKKRIVAQYLPPENTQRFRHGGPWSNPGNDKAHGGQMQTHSAVLETRFDEIVNNDLAVIERSFSHVSEGIHRQFAQMLYSTVGEACKQSGNVIDAKAESSLEAAFMAMLEKIELGIDKDGTVSMPEIHVSPAVGERMMAALENTPQEYKDRVEALKARKIAEAQAREAERKAKFVRYGPEPCAS
jgi:hypothetical protein